MELAMRCAKHQIYQTGTIIDDGKYVVEDDTIPDCLICIDEIEAELENSGQWPRFRL